MKKKLFEFILVLMLLYTFACNNVEGTDTTTTPNEENTSTTEAVEEPTTTPSSIVREDVVPVIRDTFAAGTGYVAGIDAAGKAVLIKREGYADTRLEEISSWEDLVAIAIDDYGVVGLRKDGTVYSIELNLAKWTDIVQVSVSDTDVVGLKKDGTIVNKGKAYTNSKQWQDIIQVSAGKSFIVGLKKDKTAIAGGDNTYGQCEVSTWTDVEMLAAGEGHTVGLRSDGTVLAAGLNLFGECEVDSWKDIVFIEAGRFVTIGIKSDGSVIATGLNIERYMEDVKTWTDMAYISVNTGAIAGITRTGEVVVSSVEEFQVAEGMNVVMPDINVVIDNKKELARVEQRHVEANIIPTGFKEIENGVLKTDAGFELPLPEGVADKLLYNVTDTGISIYLKADIDVDINGQDFSYAHAQLGGFGRRSLKAALSAAVSGIVPTWIAGGPKIIDKVNDSFTKAIADMCTLAGIDNVYKEYKLVGSDGYTANDAYTLFADLYYEYQDKIEYEDIYVYTFSTATDYQIRSIENEKEYEEVRAELIKAVSGAAY